MPRIPDVNLDTCVFLYTSRETAEKGEAEGGCGFLAAVSVNQNDQAPYWYYVVTNAHLAKSCPVIRINTIDGGTDIIDLAPQEWFWPESSDDFAVAPISVHEGYHYSGEALDRFADRSVI